MDFLMLLLLLPIVGGLWVIVLPNESPQIIRRVAVLTSALCLGLSLWLGTQIDFSDPSVQLYSQYQWNPRLGTYFVFGVDGLSYPFIVLAHLLTLVALLVSGSIKERVKSYYFLVLLLETATTGVFITQGWALFYVFWELVLIPLFFLIDRWGGVKRQTASLNFVLYTMRGSIFMLLSLLVLFDKNPEHSFLFESIRATAQGLSAEEQQLIFLGLLIGFGVKMPIFPLHGWLPLADVEAPSPIAILLSGVLVKMGAYGLIRSLEILPLAALYWQNLLMLLGVTGMIYGGLLAWRQRDLRRMVAYSSVSHLGVVLVGIASLSTIGLTGALVLMVAHGLASAALFMLVGLLYERTQWVNVDDFGGLIGVTPYLSALMLLALIAGVGMPGTAGFIAELHLLIASFQRWGWWVLLLSLGLLITAVYSLRTAKLLFTGPQRPALRQIPDLSALEFGAGAALIGVTLLIGFYPAPLLYIVQAATTQWASVFVY